MPQLSAELVTIYNAFSILNRSRTFSEAGEQAISCSEVESCLNLIGEKSDEKRWLYLRLISQMDAFYLEKQRKKK